VIHLRSFRKHDLPRLYELDQSCFAADTAYSMADLRHFLSTPRSVAWVAEGEGGVVGFLILERVRIDGIMIGHLITIDVDGAARRLGVGSLLLGAAETHLRGEGISRLTLEVSEENPAALAFYRRFGFTATGHIPNYYAGRTTALVMEKEL